MFKRRDCAKISSNRAGLIMLLQYRNGVSESANSGILLPCLPAEWILVEISVSAIFRGRGPFGLTILYGGFPFLLVEHPYVIC
jgi:hypothetical protein